MFKFFSILIYFVKEIIFDNSDEYNFKSSKFNVRKFIIFIIVIFSFVTGITMTIRTYALAKTNLELKALNAKCVKINDSDSSDEANSKPNTLAK